MNTTLNNTINITSQVLNTTNVEKLNNCNSFTPNNMLYQTFTTAQLPKNS